MLSQIKELIQLKINQFFCCFCYDQIADLSDEIGAQLETKARLVACLSYLLQAHLFLPHWTPSGVLDSSWNSGILMIDEAH